MASFPSPLSFDPPPASKRRWSFSLLLSALVLVILLAVTYRLWQGAKDSATRELQKDFDARVIDVNNRIEQRMLAYAQVLRGFQGLYASSIGVQRDEFRSYNNSLRLDQNYPGIQGIGFAQVIAPAQKNKLVSSIRKQGFPDFNVWPAGKRDTYTAIIYIEPFSGDNLRPFGYDMYAEPVRRVAMEMARDTGDAALSGRLKLVADTGKNKQAGFKLYLPVYKNGAPHDTLTQRRANLTGWVYALFRMDDLMQGILGKSATDIDIEIYDSAIPTESSLIYDADHIHHALHKADSRFQNTSRKEIINYPWTIVITSLPAFDARLDIVKPRLIAVFGITASLLLALLTWLLATGRERALSKAYAMTRELQESESRFRHMAYELTKTEASLRASEERLKLAVASGKVGVWEYVLETRELIWDDTMFELYNARREDFSGAYDAWATRLHPEDKEATEASLQQAIDGTGSYEPEFRIVWPNGEIRYIKGHAHIVRDQAGKAVRMIGTNWDNWAHAQTQQQLQLAYTAINKSKTAFFWISPEGQVTYVNDYACQSLGYSFDELVGLYIWDFDPDFPPEAVAPTWAIIKQQGAHHLQTRHRRKDGVIFPVEVTANHLGENQIFCSVQDITERKKAEAREHRLGQLYKSLSEVNQAIVRMEQQAELFPLVCRCAVEFGGMRMAFIALLDEDSGLMVPEARYGNRLEYLDGVTISSRADVPEGRGSCGTAFRENRPVIINDYFNDPMTIPWRKRGADCGWRSVAAFPIQRGGKPYAVLNVFHEQLNAFDDEVTALLDEMTKDIAFALDNFDRETARKAGEASQRLAASVYETSSEAMMVMNAERQIIAINPAFTEITGYSEAEVLGKNSSILRSEEHDQALYDEMWEQADAAGKWQGEIWDKRKNGEVYPKWLTMNTIFDQNRSVQHYVALFTDITERKLAERTIWQQANYDRLTGLPNRQMFHDRMDQEIKKSHRAGLPLALIFLDLDRFKEVNDTLGHDMGDVLLKEAAHRLTSCVRETDTVARLGGDEFTIILGELDDTRNVERVTQDILRKLSAPFQLGNDMAYISASIGITLYPDDATTTDVLLKNADQAMYAAKNKGRNRYHYFTQSMQKTAQSRMRIANDLRDALAAGQFRVYYQPIVDLQTGHILKAEALIRWEHPEHGLIGPVQFISVAEETGLIIDIGEWVFHQAADQVGRWRKSHHAEFQISVNKSPVQFHNQGNNHASWTIHLDNLGLPGQAIVVEITEGLLLDTGVHVTDRLQEFREGGIQVSLDDFGTGYSSLSYLNKFDIDFLKIDQSFVRNLSPGSSNMALCEAIIVMAHKLGMKVIAEGIETKEQRDLLTAAGCDYGQGYLFSEPVPAEQFEQLLIKQGSYSQTRLHFDA